MLSKNSLAALKAPKKEDAYQPVLHRVQTASETPSKVKRNTIGRPPKAKAQKRTYKITLSLTPKQGEEISAKAGIAGEATYLYDQLLRAGIISSD